jgi:hypothetical protein
MCRRHGCLKSAAPIDKCAHAVSQAKAFGEKNRSGVQRAVCVDRRRACSLGGNDTTTCRIDSILLPAIGAFAWSRIAAHTTAPIRGRETIMSTNRTKMTKDELELFQKATEAMRLFSENPDAMRRFVDALKKGNFSEARMSLNASLDRRREEGRAAADPSGIPSGKRKK